MQIFLLLAAAFGVYQYYPWLVAHLMVVVYIALVVGGCAGVYSFMNCYFDGFCGLLSGFYEVVLVGGTRKIRLEKAKRAKEAEAELYREWLKTELAAGNAPPKVDLKHLPKPFKSDGVLRLRTAFGVLKARVCKPYAR